MPPELLLAGVGSGAVYGLVALALVLVYRGSGVLSFAHGEFGTLGLFLAAVALNEWGWSYALAVLFALACVAVLGGGVERLVIRPLAGAPRVTAVVATAAVGIVIGTVESQIWGVNPRLLRPLMIGGIRIGDGVLPWQRVLALGGAAAVALLLLVLFKRTTFGLGIRALAEDADGLALTGLSPRRVSRMLWAGSAALAALAAIVVAPAIGAFFPFFMTGLLLKSFAAAILGGLESPFGALAGGLVIGAGEAALTWYAGGIPGIVDAAVFGAILLVLLVRPSGLFGRRKAAAPAAPMRPVATQASPHRAVAFVPGPALGRVVRTIAGAGAVLGGAAIVGAAVSEYTAFVLGWAAAFAVAAVGLNVLTGYAGQISFGHAGFVGLGAAVTGHLVDVRGWPYFAGLAVAVVAGAAAGALVGLPALRVRGLELAVATMGFGVFFQQVVLRQEGFTHGAAGLRVPRPSIGPFDFSRDGAFLVLLAAALLAAWWIDRNTARTKAGRAFAAVREDERMAAALGIEPRRYKIMAFVVAGALAGFGGGLFAALLGQVSFEAFEFSMSLAFVTAVVVGGLRSRLGAMAGAALLVGTPQALQSLRAWGQLAGGLGMLTTIARAPGGMAELTRRSLDRLLRRGAPPIATRAFDVPATIVLEGPMLNGPAGRPARREGAVGADGPPILLVEGVTVHYDGRVALDGISLEVGEREIVGMIGPNGAGKTTLFEVVSGFVPADRGRVLFGGADLAGRRPSGRAALGIARTFQSVGLMSNETVLANVLAAQHRHLGYSDLAGMAALPSAARGDARALARARDALEMLGLGEIADTAVGSLPHGTRKLVELAGASVTDPRLLMLDEPSSGLSPAEAGALGERLTYLAGEIGCAVLLIEHHVPLVRAISARVYALAAGRMIASGPSERVVRDGAVVDAYLGEPVSEAGPVIG